MWLLSLSLRHTHARTQTVFKYYVHNIWKKRGLYFSLCLIVDTSTVQPALYINSNTQLQIINYIKASLTQLHEIDNEAVSSPLLYVIVNSNTQINQLGEIQN